MKSIATFRGLVSRGFTALDLLVAVVILGILSAVFFVMKSTPVPKIMLDNHSGSVSVAQFNDLVLVNGARPGVAEPVHKLSAGNYIVIEPPENLKKYKIFGLRGEQEDNTTVWFSSKEMNRFGADYFFFVIKEESEEYKMIRKRVPSGAKSTPSQTTASEG